jgi:hypothetical protein
MIVGGYPMNLLFKPELKDGVVVNTDLKSGTKIFINTEDTNFILTRSFKLGEIRAGQIFRLAFAGKVKFQNERCFELTTSYPYVGPDNFAHIEIDIKDKTGKNRRSIQDFNEDRGGKEYIWIDDYKDSYQDGEVWVYFHLGPKEIIKNCGNSLNHPDAAVAYLY